MTIETTSTLTNSIRAQYIDTYLAGVKRMRLYDQVAVPYTNFSGGLSQSDLMRGSSVVLPFVSGMAPGTAAISETADVNPQVLKDATATITPTSRGEVLQWSEKLDMQVYTDYDRQRVNALSENMTETVEALAIDVALAGTWLERDASTRAGLDAGSSGDRCSDANFRMVDGLMQSLLVPGYVGDDGQANTWLAIMHPWLFHDIQEGGNVDSIGLYQDKGIHLNWELGKLGNFRLVSSAFAKVFMCAGAANGTTDVGSDTVNGAISRLGKTVVTTNNNSTAATAGTGKLWMVGTIETGNTFHPTNEFFKPLSASTYTITVAAQGPNGGWKYDHASGATVDNSDSVFPILFAGPQSLVKIYATDIGEYGQLLDPKETGMLNQWTSQGWKFYGNYGLISQSRLVRGEYTVSYQA